MKFLKYINEARNLIFFENDDTVFKDMEKVLNKDCKPYLKLLKGKPPLFRATSNMVPMHTFLKKSVRKDRIPMGTNPVTFNKLNDWLQKNKHVRRDKAVSTSSKKSTFFGVPYYFFPIGKFDYTWVRSRDINKTDTKSGWNSWSVEMMFNPESIPQDAGLETQKLQKRIIETFNDQFMTNKGFKSAYRKEYEIWFQCKEYYLVNPEDYYLIGRVDGLIGTSKDDKSPFKDIDARRQ